MPLSARSFAPPARAWVMRTRRRSLRSLLDQAPDLAVVEEDALAGSYVGEHLWQRTRDARRYQDQTVGGAGRGTARLGHSGQYQDVALSQDQRLVASRQGPDPPGDGAVPCGAWGGRAGCQWTAAPDSTYAVERLSVSTP
jgi:hypothetical protein